MNSGCFNSTLPDEWSLNCSNNATKCIRLEDRNQANVTYLERGCATPPLQALCNSTIGFEKNTTRSCSTCDKDNCNTASSLVGLNSLVISCLAVFISFIKFNMF